jgi:NAD/NADP transhydrogenase alpha subunit
LAALICATINVVGGFLVTDRMLKMFKKKWIYFISYQLFVLF